MFAHGPQGVIDAQPAPVEVEFLRALVDVLDIRYAIETGCYHGTTAAAIGRTLSTSGWLDTMDTDEYSVGLARQECVGLPVGVHHCSSLDFTPDCPVDLLFVDGDPALRGADLAHFAPHMVPLGLAVVHDAKHLAFKADDLGGWDWVNLPTPRGMLLLQRG
jgi:predicted O-methyltransferase YrrM